MKEIQDVSDALMRILPGAGQGQSEIESIRHATIGVEHVPALIEDPISIVKGLGVPVQEHSRWNVTTVNRNAPVQTALARRVIIIIIHFSNCSGVIVVAY